MANGWFRKRKKPTAEVLPEGLWTQCPSCRDQLFTREWERNLKVCHKCGHHFRISAHERIAILLDEGSFREIDAGLRSANPLGFPGYAESLERNRVATGMSDACVSGVGTLSRFLVSIAVTDCRFMMGSMGSVVGERVARAVELATAGEHAVVLVSGTGGGARMQEGLLSLMQMAKTSGALARHHSAGLPAVVVDTDPSMGGVTASWGSLGDLLIAEPGALLGFAGLRVAQQATTAKAPPNFQTAEFHLVAGHLDRVVVRRELKETIARYLAFCGARRVPGEDDGS